MRLIGTFSIGDQQCSTTLPFSEGLFMDLEQLSDFIGVDFHREQTHAAFTIMIPTEVQNQEEIELSSEFCVQFDSNTQLRGSYYIIISTRIVSHFVTW
jgi:hypothetical protein